MIEKSREKSTLAIHFWRKDFSAVKFKKKQVYTPIAVASYI